MRSLTGCALFVKKYDCLWTQKNEYDVKRYKMLGSLLGSAVNAGAIVLATLIGILLKKGINKRLSDVLMKAMGLCTLYIGITGALKGEKTLVLILSMVIGCVIGEGLRLEDGVNKLGKMLESKVVKDTEGSTFGQGFVTSTLMFCVGAMAIVGSLESGLNGNHEVLYNKALMDFGLAVMFAATYGIGVAFSAVSVFVYQGLITILAVWIAPYLSEGTVAEMTCVGSVILIGLALNMVGVGKFKVMNYIPAIFLPILLCMFL